MLAVAFILIAWDIVAFFTGPSNDTESHIILEFASENFTLPFAMSGLLGHWFWPRDTPPLGLTKVTSFFAVVVPTMMLMSVVDVFLSTPVWMLPVISPVGYVFGSLFWPQSRIK